MICAHCERDVVTVTRIRTSLPPRDEQLALIVSADVRRETADRLAQIAANHRRETFANLTLYSCATCATERVSIEEIGH